MKRLIIILILMIPLYIMAQDPPTPTNYIDGPAQIQGKLNIQEIDNAPSDSSLLMTIDGSGNVQYRYASELSNDLKFDSDREVLRNPFTPGTNIGGDEIIDIFEYAYFVAPTITLTLDAGTSVIIEVGLDENITVSGATTNPGLATLSNGIVQERVYVSTAHTFDDSTTFTFNVPFTPRQSPISQWDSLSYSFRAQQDWSGGAGETGTIYSSIRYCYGVYPVFYGVSSTDYSGGFSTTDFYNDGGISSLVTNGREGDKTVNLSGSGYIYYAFPNSWSDTVLTTIIDHNGFDNIDAFNIYHGYYLVSDHAGVNYTKMYVLYRSKEEVVSVSYTGWQFNQ